MQAIIILLMLLYVAALSRSFFSFSSKENEQDNPLTETKKDVQDISSYFFEESNSKVSDREDDQTYFLPNFSLEYRGQWDSIDHIKQSAYFKQNTGLITFTSRNDELSYSQGYFDIWCYDGNYVDQKALKISFEYNNSVDFNAFNFNYENANVEFKVVEFDTFEQISEKACKGSYKLDFINAQTMKPYTKITNDNENVIVQIRLTSHECAISLNATTTAENPTFESDTMDYSIMMTLLCLAHLYACIQMIKSISQDELTGHGYSLITLSILTSWDIFLCFFHFYQAFYAGSNYFQYFISPAFWYFIVATIFETRLLTIVWKAKYYRSFQNVSEVRTKFASFYIRLYGFLSSFIFLGYMFLPSVWFLYLTSLFFVPQIVHNAIRGLKPKFEILYIFFFGFLRTLLPMYVRGCSSSIFHLTPSEGFILNYAGIISIQIFLMFAQSKLGSRFFIPARFLPPKYNYFINKTDALCKEENCSICMDPLGQEPSGVKTPILNHPKKCQGQVMRTPCHHIFHGKCLKDWMEIKLECPYCRSTLPSLD